MSCSSRRQQVGFTLVELLIVVIIIGILAAVAIPLYRGTTTSSYLTEADAGLGVIRRAMRTLILSQSGSNNWASIATKYTAGSTLKISDIRELQIDPHDLDGRFFDNNSYRMTTLTNTTFVVKAYGDSSTTPYREAVAGLTRVLDQDGEITTISTR